MLSQFLSRRPGTFLVPPMMFALLGCGGTGDGPKTVPVAGTVTLDDHPMSLGTVTFYPDKAKGNTTDVTPTGPIQSDGTYKVTTGGKDGAPVGWYKVTVSPQGMPSTMPADGKMPPPARVNPKFQQKETGLSVEVSENAPAGAYDLKVTK